MVQNDENGNKDINICYGIRCELLFYYYFILISFLFLHSFFILIKKSNKKSKCNKWDEVFIFFVYFFCLFNF
jgi:hypothetical protein